MTKDYYLKIVKISRRLPLFLFLLEIFKWWGRTGWLQIFRDFILEGEIAADECKHYYSQTPDIGHHSVILFPSDHLWCCVARWPAGCLKLLSRFISVAESEINNFDIVLKVEEKIFGLEISVSDLEISQIFYSGDYLLDVFTALFFLDFMIFHDVFEELSSTSKFHDQEDCLRRFYDL